MRLGFLRASVFALAALVGSSVFASQNTTVMPVVGPLTMGQVMTTLNAALASILSVHSGPTAPANSTGGAPQTYQMWVDTSVGGAATLRIYDGTSWAAIGTLNTTTHAWSPTTAITSVGDLLIGNGTNSTTRLAIGPNGYVPTSNGTTLTYVAPSAGVFAPPGTGGISQSFQQRGQRQILSTDYASGSGQSTTGTISASSSSLALAAAKDFVNGQYVRCDHCGPAPTIGAATSPSVTPTGSGSTAYAYRVASCDNQGGVKAATSAVTTTNAATLSKTVYNTVVWTAGTGSPACYIVYATVGAGAEYIAGVTTATSYRDGGFAWASQMNAPWAPLAHPTSDLADWLVTTIASGGGTTTLTLTAAATTAATSTSIAHDDTVGLQNAVNYAAAQVNGGQISVPCATHNITGTINVSYSNVGFFGLGHCSQIAQVGASFGFNFSGASSSAFIFGNTLSGLYITGFASVNGACVYAKWVSVFDLVHTDCDHTSGGPYFVDFNDIRLSYSRVYNWWGYAQPGLALVSDSTNYACCAELVGVLVTGDTQINGTGTDKVGILIDGFSATIQGWAVSSIETEGDALRISNAIGNASSPQFVNLTDFEQEYSNGSAISCSAGSNIFFANPQVYGNGNVALLHGSACGRTSVIGGFLGGSKNNGVYIAGKNFSLHGTLVYDNSSPTFGGTAGTGSGIELVGSSSGTDINTPVGTTANPTWQAYPIVADSGATNFSVCGVFTGNLNNLVSNNAGYSATQTVCEYASGQFVPSIGSGFGTAPSVTGSNGYKNFRVNVGTGGAASAGVINLPQAAAGWSCIATDITTKSASVSQTQQTSFASTTSVQFANYSDVSVQTAWASGDVLSVQCSPY